MGFRQRIADRVADNAVGDAVSNNKLPCLKGFQTMSLLWFRGGRGSSLEGGRVILCTLVHPFEMHSGFPKQYATLPLSVFMSS